MKRIDKEAAIAELKEKLSDSQFFYLTDSSTLTVGQVNALRGLCYKNDIEMKVVKNTLVKKAMESLQEEKNFEGLYDSLKGPTAIMFSQVSNAPAKIIDEFRKSHDKPVLKAAYIDSDIYIGDGEVATLKSLKSKEELIGDIIMILQSPAKNVISGLKSSGSKLSGILKTLSERPE